MDMETLRMVKQALTGRWNGGDWIINSRIERCFYRVKLAICLILNAEYSNAHKAQGISWDWLYMGVFVQVTYINGGVQPGTDHSPTVYYADELAVGVGYFKNWVYVVNQVSSD